MWVASAPQPLLDFATSSSVVEGAEVVSKAFDYVSPGLVDVFHYERESIRRVTCTCLKENYHQDDIVL